MRSLIALSTFVFLASSPVWADSSDPAATQPVCSKDPKACQQPPIEVKLPDPGRVNDIKIEGTKPQIVTLVRSGTAGPILIVRSLRPFKIGKWDIRGNDCTTDLELGRSCRALLDLSNEKFFDQNTNTILIEFYPTHKKGEKAQYFRIGTLRKFGL